MTTCNAVIYPWLATNLAKFVVIERTWLLDFLSLRFSHFSVWSNHASIRMDSMIKRATKTILKLAIYFKFNFWNFRMLVWCSKWIFSLHSARFVGEASSCNTTLQPRQIWLIWQNALESKDHLSFPDFWLYVRFFVQFSVWRRYIMESMIERAYQIISEAFLMCNNTKILFEHFWMLVWWPKINFHD